MSKILLIHNSDYLQSTLSPKDSSRPLFYWYTDRFASHIGTHKYLYICVVDTDDASVELEYRHTNPAFHDVHQKFLEYKEFKENNPHNLHYAEPGIITSYSSIKPSMILEANTDNDNTAEHLAVDFKVVYPTSSQQSMSLFKGAYKELYTDKPIPFVDMSTLTELAPELLDCLPVLEPLEDAQRLYVL